MKSVCMVDDVDFGDLLEAHKDVAGASLEGEIDLDLVDPLYDVRNERSMDNSAITSSQLSLRQ